MKKYLELLGCLALLLVGGCSNKQDAAVQKSSVVVSSKAYIKTVSHSENSQSTSRAQLVTSSSSTQPTQASAKGTVTIIDHTFHWIDSKGAPHWEGDNGEGELDQWYANDPAVVNNKEQAQADLQAAQPILDQH